MNIQKIRKIFEQGWGDEDAKHLLIKTLAEDEDAIVTVLEILDYERKRRKKLLAEMNLELSRAHLTIEKPEINKDDFVIKNIIKFYRRNKDQVSHVFANMDTKYPDLEEDKLGWDSD
jgi:phosphomannomutase